MVKYFGCGGEQASEFGEVVVDSLSTFSLSFAVALGGGECFGVHDFLGGELLQLSVEAEGGGGAAPVEEAGVGGRLEEGVVVAGREVDRVEGVNRREPPWVVELRDLRVR